MKRDQKQLPAMVIDKKLYKAIMAHKKEIEREIQARIDVADAVQFILGDALGGPKGFGSFNWILQEEK